MSKLYFEDYLSGMGKVEIPDANHVGIELDCGAIIEVAQYRGGGHEAGRQTARISSHDAISIDPAAANCFEVGPAQWVRDIDIKHPNRKMVSQVSDPPGFQLRAAATHALNTVHDIANRLSGHSVNTSTCAKREAMSLDLTLALKALRKVI